MSKHNIADIYSLSPLQQGMLFHALYDPASGAYHQQLVCTLEGILDLPAFKGAWRQVVERHAVLRTFFTWQRRDRPLQVVRQRVELPWQQQDWRELAVVEQKERLEQFLQADRELGFDLSTAPLLRLALFQIDAERFYFVWSHHHLLLDGWSLPIVLRDVFACYEAFGQGRPIQLAQPRAYRDYILWLQRQDLAQAERFWRETLRGFAAPTPLRVERRTADGSLARPESPHKQYGRLSSETTERLRSLAREHQLTLNTLVQGAWALLLSRYSGEPEVVYGTTVSGRPVSLPGVEGMVGLFINTLPVRVRVAPRAPRTSLLGWLKQLQAQQAEIRQYEYAPLAEVQRWSDVPGGTPLFEHILVFENYPLDASLRQGVGNLRIGEIRFVEKTNYPLSAAAAEAETGLALRMSYDGSRFDASTIARMLSHWQNLLEGIVTRPEQRLSDFSPLAQAERRQLLVAWNDTGAAYPADRCVHQLFEVQVEQSPDAVAVVFPSTSFAQHPGPSGRVQRAPAPAERTGHREDQHLTYRELNRRANQLAHHLQARGVGPEVLVGLCVERSLEMVVGVLGILKASGAYVPLDPAYPQQRLAFMLADAQAPVLLTQERLIERFAPRQVSLLCLDADWAQIARAGVQNPHHDVTPENPAYVIYTSGSTGQPKGVVVQHRSVMNLAQGLRRLVYAHHSETQLRISLNGSLAFDTSVKQLVQLVYGHTLCILSRETRFDRDALLSYLRNVRLDIFDCTPSQLRLFVRNGQLIELNPAPAGVLVGGEAIETSLWEALVQNEAMSFYNLYGPTECTVDATVCRVQLPLSSPSIGRPIANTQVYILDPHLRPLPVGVPGELCIGGTGLARGYRGRPGLTAEKFIPCPPWEEGEGKGARLYRTGDLARFLPDGNIEFLGRMDYQIKLRGFRIELGEIEAVLNAHPLVQETALLVRQDTPGDPSSLLTDPAGSTGRPGERLVAYVVPTAVTTDSSTPTTLIAELRAHLKQRLPDYMLPAAFVALDALPLTPNGKVDRRALPAPERDQIGRRAAFESPRTPTEEMLVGIWAQVLGVEQVSVHDSFFELGGHSLLATQVISRVRQAFQVELPLRALFEAPTAALLAGRIETLRRETCGLLAPPIVPVAREGEIPLSFAQQRLWFLDQWQPGNAFYNVSNAVRFTGLLDVAALEQSFQHVIARHEVLRTTFAAPEGRPVQVIAPALSLKLPLIDLRRLSEVAGQVLVRRLATQEAQHSFDLTYGPLIRAILLQLSAQEHVLLLTMHHIVSDGWSTGVLIRELATLYQAFSIGETASLPDLCIQYADFALWQREWLRGEVLERQLAYWKEQLRTAPAALELPTDRPRPPVQTFRGATHSFVLPESLTEALEKLSRRQEVTLFMTLLAAFKTLLSRYTGQADVVVGSPIANRNRREIEDLIGFFVNVLALRTDFAGNPTFRELLGRVREVTLGAHAHQDLPFEMLVEELRPERDLSRTPLFQVLFALQNAPRSAVELPGLTLHPLEVGGTTARFDLALSMVGADRGLRGVLEYNTDLFDAVTIDRLVGHFRTLLEGIVATPERLDQRISDLPFLTQSEQHRTLVAWNDTQTGYSHKRCLHELFETQVARRPDAVAVVWENEHVTYRELNRRANQLAHYVRGLGVEREVLVGLCVERSVEMIVGILGVYKAAGAYLPIDPAYPQERLAWMLSDAQAPLLLTQQSLASRLSSPLLPTPYSLLLLDADWDAIAQKSDRNPVSGATPESLAYVIYTSGSTGRPKGVLLAHRGLTNVSAAQIQTFALKPGDRVLQFASLSFDASIFEICMALRTGATLCLGTRESLLPGPGLGRFLQDYQVTVATLTPSALAALSFKDLSNLRIINVAGEACSAELVTRWGKGRNFFNLYGPTEGTIWTTAAECDAGGSSPPIGRPIANTRVYILDPHLHPLPVGVPGELCIGGVGLARGYLNRPELTAEKFVPAPPLTFLPGDEMPTRQGGRGGERLYRTGDLARYLPDGNIEFLGRIDHQVKLRGFRIELGEIEAALGRHPLVREAVVLLREDGLQGRQLVAYVVARDGQAPAPDELRRSLQQKLPQYMLPSVFVTLDALPLTSSGKVDRRQLPAPDQTRPQLETAFVPPRTPTEQTLSGIWAEILGLEQVGVHDDFFDLGGHSLLATQVASRVRATFQVELPLQDLFETPTVAGLAQIVEQTLPVQTSDASIAVTLEGFEEGRL
jgi:amino acid adenylation domain-containing protein